MSLFQISNHKGHYVNHQDIHILEYMLGLFLLRVSKNLKTKQKQNHHGNKLIIDINESSNMILMRVNMFYLIIFKLLFFNSGWEGFQLLLCISVHKCTSSYLKDKLKSLMPHWISTHVLVLARNSFTHFLYL